MQCQICRQDNPAEAHFCANCGATLVTAVEPPPPVATAVEYTGFWMRLVAATIDGVIIWFISFVPSSLLFYIQFGSRFSFLPSVAGLPLVWLYYWWVFWFPVSWLYYWLFTSFKGQTPGKMELRIKVVNTQGNRPGLGKASLREVLGKTVSAIIFCLGFLWIIRDKQKRGWHDIIANTRVVKVVRAKSKE